MAAANYDEVEHAATSHVHTDCNNLDPLYKWDTHFPERLSRLHLHEEFPVPCTSSKRRQRRCRNRQSARFKTQPVTFDEIKEVDEEDDSKSKEGLKHQFTAFSRSMDGLLMLPSVNKCSSALASSGEASSAEELTVTEKSQASGSATDLPFNFPAGLPGHDRSRARRSKRRAKRGIEELPELEKEVSDSQAG